MNINPNIFRAYDIRGVVGDELNADVFELIGCAFAEEVIASGLNQVVVGRDARLSSMQLANSLIKGLKRCGCAVIDIGEVPTPVLYYAALCREGNSLMITGSHNPPQFNGCKMMIGGTTLALDAIQGIYQRIKTQNFASRKTGSYATLNVAADYQQDVLKNARLARPLKVVVDAGNGVAGAWVPALLRALGCEVIELYCTVDGNFPNHHPDPAQPQNTQDLRDQVVKLQADMGFAFDGDADRIALIDDQGKQIMSDRVLMLLAQDLITRHPRAQVIFDVKCSSLLPTYIKKIGGVPLMWKTGHSLIKHKLKETKALLAGELSGHLFFAEQWNGADDALFAAVKLSQIISQRKQTVSQIFAEFPDMVATPEINIAVPDDKKFALVEQLAAQKSLQAGGQLTTIDGVRVDYPYGWGLIRASNTTPSLVLRFEAQSVEKLKQIHHAFEQALQQIDRNISINLVIS